MPIRRTLSLKREVLRELTDADLTIVNGAAPPQTTTVTDVIRTGNTDYSCLDYISCNQLACVIRDATDITERLVATVKC